jgi:hypothetical protein
MGARSRSGRQRYAPYTFRATRAATRESATRTVRDELEDRDSPTGFPLEFQASPNTLHEVLEQLGFDALRPTSLEFGGRAHGSRFRGFVTRWRGSATEADRRFMSEWLEQHGNVVEFDLGKLVRY